MNIFEWIAEQKIRKAQQEGQFDHLQGAGKPLDLNDNPFEPQDQRLAFHILKNSGFKLPWIERKFEIDQALEAFRKQLRSYLGEAGKGKTAHEMPKDLAEELTKINRKIIDYNLSVPLDSLHRPSLYPEIEIRDALKACMQ